MNIMKFKLMRFVSISISANYSIAIKRCWKWCWIIGSACWLFVTYTWCVMALDLISSYKSKTAKQQLTLIRYILTLKRNHKSQHRWSGMGRGTVAERVAILSIRTVITFQRLLIWNEIVIPCSAIILPSLKSETFFLGVLTFWFTTSSFHSFVP